MANNGNGSKDTNNTNNSKKQKATGLMKIYENKELRTKIEPALRTGKLNGEDVTYKELIELAQENYGVKLSYSSLSRYKQRMEESDKTGVPLKDLLDGRGKPRKVVNINEKREPKTPDDIDDKGNIREVPDNKKRYISDIQVLEEMIEKGLSGLRESNYVDQKNLLKALELHNKMTGGKTGGLSMYGVEELTLRSQAKIHALTEVVMKYIPEEQHSEVLDSIDKFEEEFYQNMDLTPEEIQKNKDIDTELEKTGLF